MSMILKLAQKAEPDSLPLAPHAVLGRVACISLAFGHEIDLQDAQTMLKIR